MGKKRLLMSLRLFQEGDHVGLHFHKKLDVKKSKHNKQTKHFSYIFVVKIRVSPA